MIHLGVLLLLNGPGENGALLIVLWCAVILHAGLAGWIWAGGLIIRALTGLVSEGRINRCVLEGFC